MFYVYALATRMYAPLVSVKSVMWWYNGYAHILQRRT